MSSVVRSVTERRESGDGSGGGSVRGGGGVASERGGVSRRTSARGRSRCEAGRVQKTATTLSCSAVQHFDDRPKIQYFTHARSANEPRMSPSCSSSSR